MSHTNSFLSLLSVDVSFAKSVLLCRNMLNQEP